MSHQSVSPARQTIPLLGPLLGPLLMALAVVIGTPAETALKISALDPARILPMWSP